MRFLTPELHLPALHIDYKHISILTDFILVYRLVILLQITLFPHSGSLGTVLEYDH